MGVEVRNIVALLLLWACWPAAAAEVAIQGSSTVFPIADAFAQELEAASGGAIRVVVAVSGTSGGFEAVCSKHADIATASRPVLRDEEKACSKSGIKLIELPIALDALTVVVPAANDFARAISVEQLRKLWGPEVQDVAMRWSDLDPAWPQRAVTLYGPDSQSGTFDYFTEAVLGSRGAGHRNYSASDSDYTLVQRIARDPDALGYFGYSYFAGAGDRLRALPIIAAPGAPAVMPSIESVRDGSYTPLTRPLFIYVSNRSARRKEVEDYVDLLLDQAPRVVVEFGYVPLSEAGSAAVRERFKRRRTGSLFADQAAGSYRLDELLER